MQSFGEINRSMIENYLLFTKTNNPDRKNIKTELAHLRCVLIQVGENIEKPYLDRLFIKNDMPKMRRFFVIVKSFQYNKGRS